MKRLKYNNAQDKSEYIIFFNPIASDKAFWRENISEEFYARYEVILFDYPVNLTNSISDTIKIIRNKLAPYLNKPIHLCGFSYGGIIVQELLKYSFLNLKSVILISSPNRLESDDKKRLEKLDILINTNELEFCKQLTRLSYNPLFIAKNNLYYLKLYANLRLNPTSLSLISKQLNQMMLINNIVFPCCTIPALYLYGGQDMMLANHNVDEISNLLPNIEILNLKDSFHIIEPTLLFENIINFLKKNDG